MTPDDFRKLALETPGAVESAHVGHPDFRLRGRIFASLGAPDDNWGMVKLTPGEQQTLVAKEPHVFKPCNGAWGASGCTYVHLASATKGTIAAALQAAANQVLAKARKKA
jgi:hypothetical protein